ncbi:hypothetical protein D9M71_806120 [compost metagenome]
MQMEPRAAMLSDDLRLGLSIAIHVCMEKVNHLVAMISQGAKTVECIICNVFARDVSNARPCLVHRD